MLVIKLMAPPFLHSLSGRLQGGGSTYPGLPYKYAKFTADPLSVQSTTDMLSYYQIPCLYRYAEFTSRSLVSTDMLSFSFTSRYIVKTYNACYFPSSTRQGEVLFPPAVGATVQARRVACRPCGIHIIHVPWYVPSINVSRHE